MKNGFIISIFLFCAFTLNSKAQKIHISTDTINYLIGDHIHLLLELELNDSLVPDWPDFEKLLGNQTQLLKISGPIISEKEKLKNYLIDLTITSYDSGNYCIPPIPVILKKHSGGNIDTIRSDSICFNIMNMTVDMNGDIVDIMGPEEDIISWKDYLVYIIAGFIIIVLLVTGLVWLIKRNRRKEPQILMPENRNPKEEAIAALLSLRDAELWKDGLIKEHYVELSTILRIYISQVFNIKALEATTSETESMLQSHKADFPEQIDILIKLFETADLVKFAKYYPDEMEAENSVDTGLIFINETAQQLIQTSDSMINEEVAS
jgi:hypothetical protein